jgi:hypothetical protein
VNRPRSHTDRVFTLFRRPVKLFISGIVALVIAILLIFRDAVLSALFNKDTIGDSVRDIRGESALQIIRVDTTADWHHKFARVDDYRLSPPEERQLQNLGVPASALILDRARRGGLPAGSATWLVYLRGHRSQMVRVLDIRPVNVTREKPFAGTLFNVYPQGGDTILQIGFDMDSPYPGAREMRDDGTLGNSYFDHKTLSLSDQESEVIAFIVYSKRYLVTFNLQVDYLAGNEVRHETVTDNGRPFTLTGFSCRPDGTLDYKQYYSQTGFGPVGIDPMGNYLGLEPKKLPDEDRYCAR